METITLTDCELTELGKPVEWFKKKVDLSAYRNGVIQIAICGTLINYGFLGIDKIKVAPALEHNLTIHNLITVSGAEGSAISVCGVDGRTVAAVDSASAVTEISVQPGSYLVAVGSLTFKLMVP